jgi:hypothetical protein
MNARFLPRLLPIIAVAVVFLAADVAWACPTCKEALASAGGDNPNLVRGFFWSILFMMSMPFLLIGIFSTVMYRAVKKGQAEGMQKVASQYSAHQPRELVEV